MMSSNVALLLGRNTDGELVSTVSAAGWQVRHIADDESGQDGSIASARAGGRTDLDPGSRSRLAGASPPRDPAATADRMDRGGQPGQRGGSVRPRAHRRPLRGLPHDAGLLRATALRAGTRGRDGRAGRAEQRAGGRSRDSDRRRRHVRVPVAGAAAHPARPDEDRAGRHSGAHHRRDRDRQGADRAHRAPGVRPARAAVRGGQLRRDAAVAHPRGAVRLREGRVHRGPPAQGRPPRGGLRRDDLPRRDRRSRRRVTGPAAALPGAEVGAPRRRPRGDDRRRQGRGRHQRRPRGGGRARNASARTSTTASTSCAWCCRRCASGPRTSRRWRASS